MNQYELNQIRSKLRKLGVGEEFARRYLKKLETDNEPFRTAVGKIDRWQKQKPDEFILQGLAWGLIAAIAGGMLAVIQH